MQTVYKTTAAKRAAGRKSGAEFRKRHGEKNLLAKRADHAKRMKVPTYKENRRRWGLEWKRKRPAQSALKDYKTGAKKRGYTWGLTDDEFLKMLTQPCFYCDFVPAQGVDRVDNALGYTEENCEPCCTWCNKAKNNQDLGLFISKCEAVVKNWHEKTEGLNE